MGTLKPYELPIHENHDPMVNLAAYPFVLEPHYFQSGMSENSSMWVRKSIADKLVDLQVEELRGMTFKIWDAWRPRDVQQKIYDQCRAGLQKNHPEWNEKTLDDEMRRYVALPENPQRIPPHTTGASIDLTLVTQDGVELNMGTGFDHFGPESAIDYYDRHDVNPSAAENRKFLHAVMAKGDFATHIDEWWHFDFGNQRWAAHKNQQAALYGEIIDPEEFNRESAKEKDHVIS